MVEHTNEDPEARTEELQKKKWEIENEINLIKIGKKPSVFDETEIKGQFYDLNKMARELLADFWKWCKPLSRYRTYIGNTLNVIETRVTLLVFGS